MNTWSDRVERTLSRNVKAECKDGGKAKVTIRQELYAGNNKAKKPGCREIPELNINFSVESNETWQALIRQRLQRPHKWGYGERGQNTENIEEIT